MKTLLLDADIIAFKMAARHDLVTAFGRVPGVEEEVRWAVEEDIADLMKRTGSDDVIVALSCREENWRMQHLPTYKHNRDHSPDSRPTHLTAAKEHMAENYKTYQRFSLEGDDVLGILATHPNLVEGETVVVSEDKDLRTVPCALYAPHRDELGIQHITPLEARQFHMWQTICGDSTDGYKGAPGVGGQSLYARAVLEEDMDALWDTVLEAYGSVGLGEADALNQARVAQILTAGWYDFQKKEAVPFEPTFMSHF